MRCLYQNIDCRYVNTSGMTQYIAYTECEIYIKPTVKMRLSLIKRILSGKPKDDKVDIRTLMKFLRAHAIRRIFLHNFYHHPLNPVYETVAELYNNGIAPIDWIRMAFQWSATKEGREFWKAKSSAWVEYLVENENNKEII